MDRARIIPFPPAGRPATPAGRGTAPAAERGLVEVHRCDQAEALVVRGLLESEGIPTLLRSRLAHSVHPFTVGAQGEVTIFVPPDEVHRSRVLLARVTGPP